MIRPPTAPPEITGLTVVEHLGGGGFADVYLYEQKALGRRVAVKVLRANASTEDVKRQFTAESRLMAALSDHINIVTIHDAAIADDGRPYLVMAYCPGLNLADRYKSGQIPLAEVLSIGVQLAGAVETAHRQGILHRDIKPANVLTAAGGRPALTDFGISVAMGAMHEEESVGLSIPWSPPEMLSNLPGGDHRADVYSLAATLYTLLARRSPYELPGRSNDQVDLITRIQRSPLTPIGRADVPRSVELVLSTGLAKEADRRYQSALDLARALQRLESELSGTITPVDISAEDPVAARAEIAAADDGRTRIRPLVIQAQQPATPPTRPVVDRTRSRIIAPSPAPSAASFGADDPDRPAGPPTEHTQLRGPARAPDYLQASYLTPQVPPDTQARPASPPAVPAADAIAPSRKPLILAIVVAVLLLAGVGTVLALRGTSTAQPPPVDRAIPTPGAFVATALTPSPAALSGKVVGSSVVFTWRNPDPQSGDEYEWQQVGIRDARWIRVGAATATVPGTARTCIAVNLIRENGSASATPASACAGKG